MFGSNHIFGISEVTHFKCRVLIDTQEYYSAYTIEYSPKEMCSLFRVM